MIWAAVLATHGLLMKYNDTIIINKIDNDSIHKAVYLLFRSFMND